MLHCRDLSPNCMAVGEGDAVMGVEVLVVVVDS